MSLIVVFDGDLTPSQENISNLFQNPKFLLIDVISPSLEEGEGLIIGFSVNIIVPVIGKTIQKYIPHTIFDSLFSQDADTENIIYLPQEVTDSPYNIYVGINPSRNCTLRIYAEVENCSNCQLLEEINDNKNRLRTLQINQLYNTFQLSVLSANQAAQNTVLVAQSTVLGIVGAPLTGGASLALPAGTAATLAPTQQLLPGAVFLPGLPLLPGG